MEANTFFLGVIALSSLIIASAVIVVAVAILKVAKSVDDKASIIVYEAANIMRAVKDTANNVEQASRIFSIFSIFKRSSK